MTTPSLYDVRLSRWQQNSILLSVIISLFLVTTLPLGIINILMVIKDDLNLTRPAMNWVYTINLVFCMAAIQPSVQLAKRRGVLQVYVFGLALMIIAFILISIGTNIPLLFTSRVLGGIANGILLAVGVNLCQRVIPNIASAWGLSLLVLASAVGFAFALLFTGIYAQFVNWRLSFWIALGLSVLSFICILPGLKYKEVRQHGFPIDWLGILILTAAAICTILLFTEDPFWGWSSSVGITFIVLTPSLLALFIVYELFAKQPLICWRLFRDPVFCLGACMLFCINMPIYSLIYHFNLFAASLFGLRYSMVEVGAAILPMTCFPLLFVYLKRPLFRIAPVSLVILIGGACSFAGALTMQWLDATTGYANIWWRFMLLGFGLAFVWMEIIPFSLQQLALSDVTEAIITLETIRFMGLIVGNVVAGAIHATVYINKILPILEHYGYPPDKVETLVNLPYHILTRNYLLHSGVSRGQVATVYGFLKIAMTDAFHGAMLIPLIGGSVVLTCTVLYGIYIWRRG